jgi:hypothetical protein
MTTLRNPWNWMQFFAILIQLFLCLAFWRQPAPSTRRLTANLLGLQLTLAYFRIIYFLRGFTVFGPLVRMIQQILADVIPFLLVLFIALFGFAMGLGIILYQNDGDFGSPPRSVISAFNYGMLGELVDFDRAFSRDTECASAHLGGEHAMNGSCRDFDGAALFLYFSMMILVQASSLATLAMVLRW